MNETTLKAIWISSNEGYSIWECGECARRIKLQSDLKPNFCAYGCGKYTAHIISAKITGLEPFTEGGVILHDVFMDKTPFLVPEQEIEAHISHKAIETWGKEAQTAVAVEEMAELIVALSHYQRERITKDDVIEEIADAQITLDQLKVMFGKYECEKKLFEKRERLWEKINGADRV